MNIGPYTLVREIGRGGMGVVFKATDTRDGRGVAIKLINRSALPTLLQVMGQRMSAQDKLVALRLFQKRVSELQRARIALVREAGTTAGLQHPNIVSIYDVGQHEGNLYIVMEYLSGASAEKLIRLRSPLNLSQRLQIVIQLCDALAYAHERGVVHLDVKPANIFVLRDGAVKVLDFGIAAIAQISGLKALKFIGTIPYMSPEQVKGTDLDGRSDIWSAGVTLFQLITGRLPFLPDAEGSIFDHIVNSPMPALLHTIPLTRELTHVLHNALHKDRERRYSSATLFAAELRRLIRAAESPGRIPLPVEVQATDEAAQATLDGLSTLDDLTLLLERHQSLDTNNEVKAPLAHNVTKVQSTTFGAYKPPDLGFTREPTGKVVVSARTSSGFDRLYFRPQCPTCRRPMQRKSKWRRFLKYNAEAELSYRDCSGSLATGFWGDAAKLVCMHGFEQGSVYSTPLRNTLEFYECGTCIQHAARLTTDALVGEAWTTSPSFELFQQGPENQKVRVFDALLSLPYRILFPFLNLLRKIPPKALTVSSVLVADILLVIFIVFMSSYKTSSYQPITPLSVEDVLATPQSYYHTMLRVSGCFVQENVTLTSKRFVLKPCGSKNRAPHISVEVVNVVKFVEEMKKAGLLGPETKPSGFASDEILLFHYDSGNNIREWQKLSDELAGKMYSQVVLLGQFEAIAPRVADRMGLGFGDPTANANELILIKVLSPIPKSR